MTSYSRTLTLTSPQETTALAEQMAERLDVGDVILLEGPIGSGKSHLSRGIIQHLLEHTEDVPSPTFTIVQTYDAAEFTIWHCDFYRLSHPDEALELGLDEAFEDAVCLIEWPDRLGSDQPENALHINFEQLSEDERRLTFSYSDSKWQKLDGLLNG
ncbi:MULTISPECIES: tRNA (adenosine(37)-N6)-threonylcarbamoyltransferase complex ATPase subunit type 1 TsaE [Halocynthiibacter]|uniref:tRNA threonylcarbamoyladenosine biosynthesis protein TsaE n=1 Tax=Halocynthiibacter halioticoli TaxID=2986804 RepID=A0AAE3J0Q0_9RHOB|nr:MULTISPECIES: tRNA (adenosine(37)-N6)-threonylcarbamoyltransferase complex ATPase subunit type 1 TsaE [Halocynthiibacter]MCV6825633.1 tRNA (adenosine(37)-N6)-threonylcarbamoyltransferase complex ATPase subunit type 1 TsaE [Halocynthiibacter halioticoli]MCW4058634.1 tRNA (adenosine(37)-N6)-threonylcarbamoyltransferase complex ATPase subunit type 1 TsaE [Halocynthiibacter sp. SDUM655004]